MLKWIHLENLALVEKADLEFDSAFNVISGETGAGKSVLMGGVGLLLGDRWDKSMLRIGSDRCTVCGEFSVSEQIRGLVENILDESQIPENEGGSLLIRRVMTSSSTRNFVNETPVTLQILRKLGEILVDIHSAHENHYLMKTSNQLAMLDRFGKCSEALAECASAWKELLALRKERDEFASKMPSSEENAKYRKEESEISNAAVTPGEDAALEEKHALASHARNLIELSRQASEGLSESEECVLDRLSLIRRLLTDMERFDPAGGSRFLTVLDEIHEKISLLSGELADYAAEIEIDEGSFHQMEERMRVLQTLKRRYGPSLEDVLSYLEMIRRSIDIYENAAHHRDGFAKREEACVAKLEKCCEVLSVLRKKAAEELEKKAQKELKKLSFAKAVFQVKILPGEPGSSGSESVEFLFSANPGVPPMPLRDVASSGELSRVMLCLKTVLAKEDLIDVLIFDEIDANIGGETASKVGDEILALAKEKQILCISHLPQIACRAHRQFCVDKETTSVSAVTTISQLDAAGRVREISRMLGGGSDAGVLAEKMLSFSRD